MSLVHTGQTLAVLSCNQRLGRCQQVSLVKRSRHSEGTQCITIHWSAARCPCFYSSTHPFSTEMKWAPLIVEGKGRQQRKLVCLRRGSGDQSHFCLVLMRSHPPLTNWNLWKDWLEMLWYKQQNIFSTMVYRWDQWFLDVRLFFYLLLLDIIFVFLFLFLQNDF